MSAVKYEALSSAIDAITYSTRFALRRLAFHALLAKDKKGRTPLALAIKAESAPAVKVLFSCFSLLLTQEFMLPRESNGFQAQHIMEVRKCKLRSH